MHDMLNIDKLSLGLVDRCSRVCDLCHS